MYLKRFSVLFFVFFFIFKTVLHSQTNPRNFQPNLPNIVQSSPEAASLGKFGEWPVSLYTGLANISIPLYQIKIHGFELPVQLSYHSGGVKVDDISSSVGAGWALNAGGVINRTIVGLPDDGQYGFLARNLRGERLKDTYNLNGSADDYVFFRKATSLQLDTEPDMFYFNFGETSGKFYFDQTGTFRCIPANSLKLISSPINSLSPLSEWRIADEKGIVYCFGSPMDQVIYPDVNGVEATWTNSPPTPSTPEIPPFVTAWYMTKVISADKADTIFFEYKQKNEQYILPQAQSYRVLMNPAELSGFPAQGGTDWKNALNTGLVLYNGAPSPSTIINRSYASGISALKKIKWKEGTIELFANKTRLDMTGGFMLDSILVSRKDLSPVKSFGYRYSYIQGRYYLDTLLEISSDKRDRNVHTFSYNHPELLPLRGSNSQDHWGFYNGKSNNSLIPSHPDMPPASNYTIKANREPDTTCMQYGSLNKIVYPTGGYSTFDYQAHRYVADGTVEGGPITPIISNNLAFSGNTTEPYLTTRNITIPFAQSITTVNVAVNNYAFQPNTNQLKNTWFPFVRVEKQIGAGTYQQVLYWDPSYSISTYPTPGNLTPNANGLYDFNTTLSLLSLTEGTYRITLSDSCIRFACSDILPVMPSASISFDYLSYGTPPPGPLASPIAGGLRIRKISGYDNSNKLLTGKLYNYDPGKLLIYPSYILQYGNDVWSMTEKSLDQAFPNLCMYLIARFKEMSSTSQTILGFTQGSPVGYELVTEQQIDSLGTDLGYSRYYYSFTGDSLNILNFDPTWENMNILNGAVPATSFDYKRGLLRSKEDFKRTPLGSYIKIHSLENQYNFNDYNAAKRYNRLRGLRIKQMITVNYRCGTSNSGYIFPVPANTASDFSYAFYDIISASVEQKQATETTYDENGTNPLTNVTNYYYDNPQVLSPSRIGTTNSKGDTIFSMITYPSDYATGTPFIDAMMTSNMTGIPIEKLSYMVSPAGVYSILGGIITTYKPNGKGLTDEVKKLDISLPIQLSDFKLSNVSKGILPFNTTARYAFVADPRYATRINISKYDSSANILQQQVADNVNHCYLWGYNNCYPVAEIIGIDYTTLNTLVTVNQGILKAPQSDQQLRDELNRIRTALKDSMVQVNTYTYLPLVGVTSKTDEAGKTVFFEYDSFNRLKLVKDQNGKILKLLDYQYQRPINQ